MVDGSDSPSNSNNSSNRESHYEPFEHVAATFHQTGLYNFPKVELHCHLDGCFRLSSVIKLAKKRSIELPTYDIVKLRNYCCLEADEDSSLALFLKKMAVFVSVYQGSREAIRELTLEALEDKAKQGIVYIELRFCPQLLASAPEHPKDMNPCIAEEHPDQLTPSEVMDTVTEAIEEAKALFPVIKARLILCCIAPMPEISEDVARLAVKYKSKGVVGIDIAGEEDIEDTPAFRPHIRAFQYAKENGLHRTAHAGEAGSASSVIEAKRLLSAERIGHGYHISRDPDVYKKIKTDQTHLECCPISSYRTGAVRVKEQHPIIQFARDKINCSLSTDDPGVMLTTLLDDYKLVADFGVSEKTIKIMNLNAAQSSFLPEDEKKELVSMLKQHYGPLN